MQIHELNTLGSTPGETDFLAIDTGFDTAKISAPDLLKPIKEQADQKINLPRDEHNQPDNGTAGQLLRTNGDGTTDWVDEGLPTDEQTEEAINKWLDNHPEATTTVEDGSLTEAKFANALKLKAIKDYVTPEMFGAVGDGVADDTVAVTSAFQHPNVLLQNTYLVSNTITSDVKNVFGTGKVKALSSFLVCNNDVVIRDIEIELSNDEASIGITCKDACIIDNVKITNGLKGVKVDNGGEKCWVTNCIFSGMYGDVARGFENLNAGESYFINNTITNISNNLDRDADGIHFWQGETSDHPYVIIKGNTFHNCRGRAIKASTSNVLIENNFITVDDDFETISNGFAIDVQKGNSVIRQNYLKAPYGILVSIRFYDSSHTIRDNFIILSSGSRSSIWVRSDDATYTSNVEIIQNTIYGTNAYSIYADFLHNGRYTIRNNKVYGRSVNTCLIAYGTKDLTCRYVVLDNINVDGTYFFEFTEVLNVYGDEKVRLKTAKPAISDLLYNIRFLANSENIDGRNDNCILETKGYASYAFSVFLYSDYFKVYNKYGQQVVPSA